MASGNALMMKGLQWRQESPGEEHHMLPNPSYGFATLSSLSFAEHQVQWYEPSTFTVSSLTRKRTGERWSSASTTLKHFRSSVGGTQCFSNHYPGAGSYSCRRHCCAGLLLWAVRCIAMLPCAGDVAQLQLSRVQDEPPVFHCPPPPPNADGPLFFMPVLFITN